MGDTSFDTIIVGAGPAGYVSAIRCAQLGMKTALVEKNPTLGGTCLNIGCIPSKALLDSSERYFQALHSLDDHGISFKGISLDLAKMLERKDGVVKKLTSGVAQLIKANNITVIRGTATLRLPDVLVETEGGQEVLKAKNIILATGSQPIELPGLEFDGDRVVSSTEALCFSTVPKTLGVVGAGAIGLEMASVWARLGSKVTVIELATQILPGWEPALAKGLQKELEKLGITFLLGHKGKIEKKTKTQVVLALDPSEAQKNLPFERVLVAVGRKPYYDGLGLDINAIALSDRGRLVIDQKYRVYASSEAEDPIPGLYAIGDSVPGPMLAHKAEDEGVAVAEILAGQAGHVNYDGIPGVVYTWPEAAMVGKTEEALKKEAVRRPGLPRLARGSARCGR